MTRTITATVLCVVLSLWLPPWVPAVAEDSAACKEASKLAAQIYKDAQKTLFDAVTARKSACELAAIDYETQRAAIPHMVTIVKECPAEKTKLQTCREDCLGRELTDSKKRMEDQCARK